MGGMDLFDAIKKSKGINNHGKETKGKTACYG